MDVNISSVPPSAAAESAATMRLTHLPLLSTPEKIDNDFVQAVSASSSLEISDKLHPKESFPPSSLDEERQTPATDSGENAGATVSKARGISIIVTLAGINFLNTMGSGLLIAVLPHIARDVGLPDSLILWPAAAYALAAGCLLIIFGAISDTVGPKKMWGLGSALFVIFTIALGLSRTGTQVILFRTCLGVAIAMCLPATVSLITHTFPRGPWRNTAFSMSGMAQPLGYALGLVLGGVFADTIGWRWAYYVMAIFSCCTGIGSIWSLPAVRHESQTGKTVLRRLAEDIDWVGAIMLSASLGMIMYVLALASSSYHNMSKAPALVLLVIAVVALLLFPFWMHRQEKQQRPALIPNRLWREISFTSVCASVFLCWASLNGFEYFTTLFYQQVQGLSALQASIRYFPQIVMGTSTNIVTVYLISRVKTRTLVVGSALISLVSPALMATVKVDENYWLAPFWAIFLCPVNPWILFAVGNLVISDAFPQDIQSLAGGIFNEVAQFGNSVGLAVTAAIAASVTEHSGLVEEQAARMVGFRAAFWTIFASTGAVIVICTIGLRNIGIAGSRAS